MHKLISFFLLAGITISNFTYADVQVIDDFGLKVTLNKPAKRIISLAPHATEQLFAAGAGQQIVAVVKYSDYPDAAKTIESIGSYRSIDIERIVALKPDLIVAWPSGNKQKAVDKLKALGLNVYQSQPEEILQIAESIEKLGVLSGHGVHAKKSAMVFRQEYDQLRTQYANKKTVRLFYQIWNKPIMTINGSHLISKVMGLCGGENVFAELSASAPKLDVEAVIQRNPEVIIASGMSEERPEWLDEWRQWKAMQAVKQNKLYFIPPDIIQRHSPRILQGAAQLCEHLEHARQS
ncbi:MAG: cobalamin-binding protein [Gammaproteobacteria bacterium]|nr:cobalamin-binding protein [Gammaproteobacteria bacterium]